MPDAPDDDRVHWDANNVRAMRVGVTALVLAVIAFALFELRAGWQTATHETKVATLAAVPICVALVLLLGFVLRRLRRAGGARASRPVVGTLAVLGAFWIPKASDEVRTVAWAVIAMATIWGLAFMLYRFARVSSAEEAELRNQRGR